MLVEDRSKHSKANKASRQEVFRSRYSTVVPLLCQFVEGWLLQVGPDSVFEVNEALWDIFFANAKNDHDKKNTGSRVL